MFRVYHVDKHNKTLLHETGDWDAAVQYVLQRYKGRFRNDRDRDQVVIEDNSGSGLTGSWGVEWGMSLEPVKVWTFASASSSEVYKTQLNTNNVLSCNCRGWTYKKPGKARWCKHTTAVAKSEGYKLVEIGQYLFVDDKKLAAAKQKWGGASTAEQKLMALIADYEKLVRKMAALDPVDMFAMAEQVQVAKFKVESWISQLDTVGPDALAKIAAADAKIGRALA